MKKSIIIAIAVFVLGSAIMACSTSKITDAERELLVTIRDLEIYGIAIPDSSVGETFLVTRNLDGSREIRYEFDAEKIPNSTDHTLIISRVEIHTTIREAQDAYDEIIAGIKIGGFLGSGKGKIIEDTSLFVWGDENYGAYLEKDSVRLGNIIVTRKGNKIYDLTIVGFYFDDPKRLHDLLVPKLDLAPQ